MDFDSIERQTEINEWEYQRKLETLFMLQLIYLAFVVLIILSVMWKYSLTSIGLILIIGLLAIAGIIALWFYRASYTRNVRDKTHWSKRRFPGDAETAPAVAPDVVAAEAKKRIAAYEAAVAAGKACPQF